jgi:hypothetical protein
MIRHMISSQDGSSKPHAKLQAAVQAAACTSAGHCLHLCGPGACGPSLLAASLLLSNWLTKDMHPTSRKQPNATYQISLHD